METAYLDLVVGNQNPGSVSVLLGNGDGTFRPHLDYATTADGIRIDFGDFNPRWQARCSRGHGRAWR